jgi:phage-related protein (TIGR01555 family)
MPSKRAPKKAMPAKAKKTADRAPNFPVDAMTVFRAEERYKQKVFQNVPVGDQRPAKKGGKKSRKGTMDGFDNFLTKIGLRNDNSLSGGTYTFDLLTRNRIKLEQAYRGSWIVGKMVDSIAEDMTREGIQIRTERDDGSIKKVQAAFVKLGIWRSLRSLVRWGRLYGGAIGVLQIEGQDLSTELDVSTISKGQFRGVAVFDRWQVNPLIQHTIQYGPDIGLPAYYQIVNDPTQLDPGYEFTPIEDNTIHYTRLIRHGGIELPFWQALTELMWGESVLERLWDRLISFDNATMSSASLIDRANLRTVGVDGLREILAAGGEAQQGLLAMFEMMRMLQTNEGLTLIDKEDTFQTTSYSFAGLADMLIQFGQQIAGACDTPLVRLFGQSPAGLNATGESDMRMYYDNIKAQQEAIFRNPVDTLLRVLWRSELGKDAPDDMEYGFTTLWQMSATDKATVAKTTTETIVGAYDSGLTDRATALADLRNQSRETGVFTNITDEMIDEAEKEADEPPMPGEGGAAVDPETGEPIVAKPKPGTMGAAGKKGLNPNAKNPKTNPETKAVKTL